MTKVETIQAAIETLPEEEFARLREWIFEKDWEEWDSQIERDSRSGKLDFLVEEARQEKAKGTLKAL